MNNSITFKAEFMIIVKEGQTTKDLEDIIEILAENKYIPISELAALGNEIEIVINLDSIRNIDGSLIR